MLKFVKFKNACLLKSALCNYMEVVEIKVIYVLNYVALTHHLYVLTLKKEESITLHWVNVLFCIVLPAMEQWPSG